MSPRPAALDEIGLVDVDHRLGQGIVAGIACAVIRQFNCGLNLGLLMRHLTSVGTPRSLQGHARTFVDVLTRALRRFWRLLLGASLLF